MKILLTAIVLFICVSGWGQNIDRFNGKDTVYMYTKCYTSLPPKYVDVYKVRQKDSTWKTIELPMSLFGNIGYSIPKEIPAPIITLVNPYLGKDTIEVKDTSIHYIKIGSQSFHIYKEPDGLIAIEPAYKLGEIMERWNKMHDCIPNTGDKGVMGFSTTLKWQTDSTAVIYVPNTVQYKSNK